MATLTFILLMYLAFLIGISQVQEKSDDFPIFKGYYLGQKPQGELAELFMPGIIPNCDLHSIVYFSPDGKYLLFNSNIVSILKATLIADGPGNIYWVDAKLIKDPKPKELK